MTPDALVDHVYEAGLRPELWSDVLQRLSDSLSAKGALLFTQNSGGMNWIGCPSAEDVMADYVAQGWAKDLSRVAPLLARPYAGFLTDLDLHDDAEALVRLPVYAEFLVPRGLASGAATCIQGAAHDAIMFTVEGFACPRAARSALPMLDRLRPHLARAATVSARLRQERDRAVVAGLAAIGAPAACLSRHGRLRSANGLFDERMAGACHDGCGRLRLMDKRADALLADTLAQSAAGLLNAKGRSIVIRDQEWSEPRVLHVIPLLRSARDVFDCDGLLVILATGENESLPHADLLQALFDLTPSEARLTRALLTGSTLQKAAADFGVQLETTRKHLKSVFQKTGVNRQADLVRLIGGYTRHGN